MSHTLIVELSLLCLFVEIFTITFHTVCFDMSSLTLKKKNFFFRSQNPEDRAAQVQIRHGKRIFYILRFLCGQDDRDQA